MRFVTFIAAGLWLVGFYSTLETQPIHTAQAAGVFLSVAYAHR